MPEQIAGGGIEGLHAVAEAENKKDAVVDQGRAFAGAGRERPTPGDAEGAGVGAVDLFQGAEA